MSETANPPRRRLFILVTAAAAATAAAVGVGCRTERPKDPAKRGEALFVAHCAGCHGPAGKGDGPAASEQRPPPRAFASRPWRYEVNKESIRKVILDGIPGTSMPGAKATFAADDVDALTEHTFLLATDPNAKAPEQTADERLFRDAKFVDLRGTETPKLKVSDADGKTLRLSELKGQLVLIYFWEKASPDSMKEMPRLAGLEKKLADRGLTVVHVCADAQDAGSAQKVADGAGVRAYVDESGVGLARFEVQTMPAVWLIGPDGQAVGRAQGARDWDDPALLRLLERWLPR